MTVAVAGEMVTVMDGALTAMLTVFDIWPLGLVAVMATALLTVAAEPVAVSFDADTYAVLSSVPFHLTTAPLWNALPFTVRVKRPTVTGLGVTEAMDGAGTGS